MAKKRYSAEEIIATLREADVRLSRGETVGEICRTLAVSEQSYFRWRREYGGLKVAQARRLKDLERENQRLRKAVADLTLDAMILKEAAKGLLSPSRRRACVDHVVSVLGVTMRRACRVVGQHRSTQCKKLKGRYDDAALTQAIIRLATQYGRYGYRRVTALLNAEGWAVNVKRVYRIWREGLKVPMKQPKRGRLWLADGSCVRLRPTHRGHVWSYDFVQDRTHDGRPFGMLVVIDEHSRECLASEVDRKLNAQRVLETLADLFVEHGLPEHIRSDNGPEFIAIAVRTWLGRLGVKTLFIEPGSPWENGYCESFNGKLRDELLNGEIFYTLKEAQVLIEWWRCHYNRLRPHSSLGYRPPAPAVILPVSALPTLPSTRVGQCADLTAGL